MRVDNLGIPISNMDELDMREEDGDVVFYDCYGNVFARYSKPPKKDEGAKCS